ncbi:kin-24 [Pristionchus pacificus]|nr:kin-24 [Pristionchus pacificus]
MAPPSSQQDKTKKNIEDQEWYHGFRPRKDAIGLIKNPGEFLVRATDTGPSTDIVITAMDDNKKTVNITLRFEAGKWFIAQRNPQGVAKHRFDTIVDLVDHYRNSPPSKHLKLAKIVSRPNWMLKHENVAYEEKDKLGAGNFCTVYKGKLTKKTGEVVTVAVKISLVQSSATDAESEEAKEARKSMMHEAQLMSFYTHDNVIQFLGVACDHQPVLVLMEFCPGGDLLSHLTKHGKGTDDREKMIYLYEASRGMFYLHKKKCVHRDLAARNCLISSVGRIKIADFGLSKLIDDVEGDAENTNSSNAQVPVRWMAPETLRKPAVYTTNSDIWAFGVMAYEIFSNGVKPWPDDPVKYVATQIRKGNMPKLPDGTPPKVADLVGRMWAMAPEKRPAMRVIARDINTIIKDSNQGSGMYPPDKMTINKIPGVKRDVYFEHDETSEFEESSGASVDDNKEQNDKVDKSGDRDKKRTKPSSKGPRRTSSLRDKQ